jgi:hypothetical protein
MASNFGDANTVVGDTSYLKRVDEMSENRDSDPSKYKQRHATNGKNGSVHNEFITLDYGIGERPFLVPIGAGGVIEALSKLDNQLQQVLKMI